MTNYDFKEMLTRDMQRKQLTEAMLGRLVVDAGDKPLSQQSIHKWKTLGSPGVAYYDNLVRVLGPDSEFAQVPREVVYADYVTKALARKKHARAGALSATPHTPRQAGDLPSNLPTHPRAYAQASDARIAFRGLASYQSPRLLVRVLDAGGDPEGMRATAASLLLRLAAAKTQAPRATVALAVIGQPHELGVLIPEQRQLCVEMLGVTWWVCSSVAQVATKIIALDAEHATADPDFGSGYAKD